MASIKDYHYLEPPLTQPQCHHSLPSKNGADLSPNDLDFSSVMNLNNSNDPAQNERQYNQHSSHQQQQQNLPAISPGSRNSSFRLPSFASLISGRPSPSVAHRDRLASSSTWHHDSNAKSPPPLHLPRIDYLANQQSLPDSSPSVSSSDYSILQQPVYGSLHLHPTVVTSSTIPTTDTSMPCDNNRARYSTPLPSAPPPPTASSEMMVDAPPTTTSDKKGRRTRKPKFISRVLNANMQWATSNSSNNKNKGNDGMTFRSFQYEHRRLSQPQQPVQHHQHQDSRRRRFSSVGTASSSLTSLGHVSSSIPTVVDSSPSSSTSPSVISTSSATKVKPRWKTTERMDLLKAIVKEKQLDDMTSFSWDRISAAVGRPMKSCKDQFRREILPALLEKMKRS